jgi:hypothetical protein
MDRKQKRAWALGREEVEGSEKRKGKWNVIFLWGHSRWRWLVSRKINILFIHSQRKTTDLCVTWSALELKET